MNFKPKYLHVASGYDIRHRTDIFNVFMLTCESMSECMEIGGRIE